MSEEINLKKCGKCKHAGPHFKVNGNTQMHCENMDAQHEESAWDTLRNWYDSCLSFEPKPTKESK